MKTDTSFRIVEIIRKEGGSRPFDLARQLGISPQALHRHLKRLSASGLLERRGRGRLTRYFLAGVADFEAARTWYGSSQAPLAATGEFVCETRDVFSARLTKLGAFGTLGLRESELSLLISVVGEIGNNCFDHNLGQWRDVPGCWFEAQSTGGRLWLCIADRGQGVFRSLSRVDPSILNEQDALVAAFEKRISGRAPEQRGNGLKFVKQIIVDAVGRGIACRSGAALLDYGPMGRDCRQELARFPSDASGTATVIAWSVR
ncbi:MAG: winged helix-turn-helix transcriptional regulator [Elusimicrobia bacterium]|nr:winged helix-turn-helix transcriptional regulator [Elusimicrobiota bacterium]